MGRMSNLDRVARELERGLEKDYQPMLGRYLHTIPPGYEGRTFRGADKQASQLMTRLFSAAFLDPAVIVDGLRSLQARIREGDLDTWRFVMSYIVGMPMRRQHLEVNGPEALQAWLEQLQITTSGAIEDEDDQDRDEEEDEDRDGLSERGVSA